ncbi:H-NS histone family protein [Edwardsiella tarda]|uniref:hypothetical protein n=1 Tax=Edwardsiella tarda TaxID=636 RepID=UPI00267074FC|nr:hypothetical protein [Edwardsiella tarda]WKS80411.1 H-NS histone family protein [Edwardsiella tarda]
MATTLDKHYTPQQLAARLTALVLARYDPEQQYIEPSAGCGNFLNHMPPNTLAYDIEPDDNQIISQDFLTTTLPKDSIILGNPPFGYACSEAIRFFNHSAEQLAHAICFIVPRSFTKHAAVLNPHYHLRYSEQLAETQFGNVSVRCMFQIWERRDYPRIEPQCRNIEPSVVKADRQTATHYLQRIGTNVGIYENLELNDGVIPIRVLNDAVLKPSFQKLIKTHTMRHTGSIMSISIPELNRLAGEIMISKAILNKLANQDEYNFGLFKDDAKAREELFALDVSDLDVLATRLEQFKNDVTEYQAQEQQRRAEELEEKKKDIEHALAAAGYTLDDIAAVLALQPKAQAKEPKAQKKQKGDKPAQKLYQVTIKGKTFECNGKVLPKSITSSTEYQSLPEEYKADLDLFMRTHGGDEYKKDFPLNASYKGVEFHLNSRGVLNRKSAEMLELYKKEHGEVSNAEFKAAVLKG